VNVGTFAYFAIGIALCAVGFIAIFSVGAPLFLTGLVMLAVSPWRERRGVLWPGIAAVWTFTVTYVLLAPLGCTGTSLPGGRDQLVHRVFERPRDRLPGGSATTTRR
jgi:hypothetical protein